MAPSFVQRLIAALSAQTGPPPEPAPEPREPRASVDSNFNTAPWFEQTDESATDAERYRAAPPLGRDTINSDPAIAHWYRKPRFTVPGPAEHRWSKVLGA